MHLFQAAQIFRADARRGGDRRPRERLIGGGVGAEDPAAGRKKVRGDSLERPADEGRSGRELPPLETAGWLPRLPIEDLVYFDAWGQSDAQRPLVKALMDVQARLQTEGCDSLVQKKTESPAG